MKPNLNRLPVGTKVRRHPDGPAGVIVGHAWQDGHWMLRTRFDDGTQSWHQQCDGTITADTTET